MLKICNILLFSIIIFSFQSYAAGEDGFLFEPGLAYATGTSEQKITGNGVGNDKGTTTGPGITLKTGYVWGPTFFGIDASYLVIDSNAKNDAVYENQTGTKATSAGPFIGWKLQSIPLRFWASYYVLDTAQIEDDSILVGTGMKAGVGYTFDSLVSVNLEYVTRTYTEMKDVPGAGDVDFPFTAGSTTYDDVKASAIILSVSMPFIF